MKTTNDWNERELHVTISGRAPDDTVTWLDRAWLNLSPREVGEILANIAISFAVNRPGRFENAHVDFLVAEVRRGFQGSFKEDIAA